MPRIHLPLLRRTQPRQQSSVGRRAITWMGLEIPVWLLIATAVGSVLLVNWKSLRAARRLLGGGKCRGGAAEDSATSRAARRVAAKLGVTVRSRPVPVTVCVNDVVLRQGQEQEANDEWSAIESAVDVVTLLNEVASVFLVARVDSDEEEERVKTAALAAGLTSDTRGPPPKGVVSSRKAVPEHRLLFCSSHIGQVAVVRQLASSVHIGGPVALLEGISRFVPSLIRIDPDAIETTTPTDDLGSSPGSSAAPASGGSGSRGKETAGEAKSLGGDNFGWREFKSLATAAGLAPAPPASAVPSSSPSEAFSEGAGTGDRD